MIWCVEDDAGIREIEVYALTSTGWEAKGFEDGASMREALKTETPSLILLDIMLPQEDGVSLLKELKSHPTTSSIPVIMATAKGMEYDKVQCLDLGADDYLVKPFGMMELVSRVRAVLRRAGDPAPHRLQSGALAMDLDKRTVFVEEQRIDLTYKEFEILRLLLSRAGMVYTRDQLYEQVWGDNYVGETRTVDVHIRTLRQKLQAYGERIETVRQVGYRWGEHGR